jgi:diadenosine tetraphosphate (Ap4A) HIT family hydrolase
MNCLSKVVFGNEDQSLLAIIPSRQLLDQSLHLVAPKKQFDRWSAQNHEDSYLFMQRIAQTWKSSNFTDQYLIYGKIDSNLFNWEIVPYQKCRTCIGRAVQQLQVLWRTVFGGIEVSEGSSKNQVKRYEVLLNKSPETTYPSGIPSKSNDSFCKDDTIERQWVVTGKKVNVLFNYAPIGFGGERLHFLVVPKEHRETFTDVTQEEYCESLELTTKLVDHITETRKTVKNVYLLNKTGVDAGQTVKHWHLHVIFSTNTAQDFWGKITVIKNILLGSSPMKKDDLAKKVGELREELKALKT